MNLRRHLGSILDQAAAGERIVIERDRRPMAVLVPFDAAADGSRESAASEEEAIRRFEEGLNRLSELGKRIRATSPNGPDAVTSVRLDRDHAEWSDNVRDHGR